METTANDHQNPSEISILARVFDTQRGQLSRTMARHLLSLGFGERDKARMHDLAVRNQEGKLSATEKEELFAYAKAGTLLSILKSKARLTLKTNARKAASNDRS